MISIVSYSEAKLYRQGNVHQGWRSARVEEGREVDAAVTEGSLPQLHGTGSHALSPYTINKVTVNNQERFLIVSTMDR